MNITEKGKLIISTKSSAGGRKVLIMVCAAIQFIFGLIILFTPDFTEVLAKSLFGYRASSFPIVIIAAIFFIGSPAYETAKVFIGSRSYCDVYEYCVSGVSGLRLLEPMQSFEIKYDELLNVTESGKTIILYTQYTKYEVLALKNTTEAVNEIRSRIPDRNKKA